MPYFLPAPFAGQIFDLGHLEPVVIKTESAKLNREIVTSCRFTTHVWSRVPTEGDEGPFIKDEGGRDRIFCPDRYKLSFHLAAVMGNLANPNLKVWQTAAERNWLHRAEVTLDLDGEATPYEIFFAVKRSHHRDPHDIDMIVESAYAFDPAREPKVLGRMSIVGVLTATLSGNKPHTQKGGRKR